MYVLNHNDVDNYPSVWTKWKTKPTKEQLVKLMRDYYTEEVSNKVADELIQCGTGNVLNGSCTRFELQLI